MVNLDKNFIKVRANQSVTKNKYLTELLGVSLIA
jgi:hypothetical protein